MVRRTRPQMCNCTRGISRFRVRRFAPPRSDGRNCFVIARSEATKQSRTGAKADDGLLRFARNDGEEDATLRLPPHPFRRALFGKSLPTLDVILRGHHRLPAPAVTPFGDSPSRASPY